MSPRDRDDEVKTAPDDHPTRGMTALRMCLLRPWQVRGGALSVPDEDVLRRSERCQIEQVPRHDRRVRVIIPPAHPFDLK